MRTGVDARDVLRFEEGKIFFDNTEFTGDVVYTGPVDELFGCCFGRLPYRTLDFQFETYDRDVYQSHGTVNYTMDEAYTRVTEFKYLTGQNKPDVYKRQVFRYFQSSGSTDQYTMGVSTRALPASSIRP